MTPDFSRIARLEAARQAGRRATLDPAASQVATLRDLVRTAAGTRFGRAHGFSRIASVRDFQDAVPLRGFDAFWSEWWEKLFPVLDGVSWPGRISFFAETSGTTLGPAKHIPVSGAMLASNRRAALATMLSFLHAERGSRLFSGRNLILGGSTALRTLPGGARSGDLSGIAAATVPGWAARNVLPSRPVALEGDWGRKLDRVVDEVFSGPGGRAVDLRSISGTPSWLLILFERLLERAGVERLVEAFPGLELVIHGGTALGPYRARFERMLGPGAQLGEVYPASEGFVAHARPGRGLELVWGNGMFFEFVPAGEIGSARPVRHWIGNVVEGAEYALVLSCNSGLFGYVIGDLVRVVDRARGAIEVIGRTAHMLSAFGEHVSGGELDRAVERAAAACGVAVTEYTASSRMPGAGAVRGGHVVVVECAGEAPGAETFGRVLDETLAAGNDDYAARRGRDVGMVAPEVRFVGRGVFALWMASRGKLGGQNKVPRVVGMEVVEALLGEG